MKRTDHPDKEADKKLFGSMLKKAMKKTGGAKIKEVKKTKIKKG